ncbi:MAG: hypothetical protein IJT24_06455 [Lachnospiraceae bacterium]|nr:hypothetical protein [Lachnospiraceae bacterium]
MGFDLSKMGQNLGQSLTGNVSKAILVVRKIKLNEEGDEKTIDRVEVNDWQGTIDDMAGKKKKKGKGGLNADLMALAQKTLDKGKAAGFKDVKSKAESKKFIALELQYNPSSVRLDTTAGRQMTYSGGAGSTQVQQYTAPASTTLSCELLFDDVNNMDAFMLSDNPVTGLTVSNFKNAVTSAAKSEYSVQRQMEGLLSLLAVPAARHVLFFWGSMCFRGEMTEVTTRYTMFNKKGYPVRGTATIQIRQGDGSPEAMDPDRAYRYDDTYWNKSFGKTFTNMGEGAAGWRQATNNSFLNLGL